MKRKVTIREIAQQAGVSLATVDRVLHKRRHVGSEAVAKVVAATKRLGFVDQGLRHIGRGVEPAVHLGLVVQGGFAAFTGFQAAITRAAAEVEERVVSPTFLPVSGQILTASLEELAISSDAIVLVSNDGKWISNLSRALSSFGLPIFSLHPESTSNEGGAYIGIDNRLAGRFAGWAIARFIQGQSRVGIAGGGTATIDFQLRRMGFRSYLHERASHIDIFDIHGEDDPNNLKQQIVSANLSGLYLADGASSWLSVLNSLPVVERPITIAHAEGIEAEAALIDGRALLNIRTPVEKLAEAIIDRIVEAATVGANFLLPAIIPFEALTSEHL